MEESHVAKNLYLEEDESAEVAGRENKKEGPFRAEKLHQRMLSEFDVYTICFEETKCLLLSFKGRKAASNDVVG